MRFLSDNSAQSIQIGAVLLFGILIIMLALWQAFVIPDQNEGIEFNHNQELQEQMTELRSTAVSMPGATTPRSVSINLGVRYPSRSIFMNPGPASGSLETIGTTDESVEILVENATAGEEEFVGVGDFWDGSTQGYNTGAIRYRPGYNLYNNAPRTVYEHSLLYNEFEREESTLPVTGQALIDDDRITLIALNGSLSENRVDRASVDIKPVSTQTRTVDVTDQGGSISIHLPTRLGVEDWQSVLSDEDNVVGVSESNELETGVKIELDDGVEYQLQMAKVGVGTQVTETDGAYIAGVDGDGAEITEGDTHELTVEVRDDYNNPKRGVTVNASADEGDLEETEKNTRANGQATFRYESSGVVSAGEELTDTVDFSITDGYVIDDTHEATSPENITMAVTVKKEEERGPGETLYDVLWDQAAIESQSGVDCDDGECTYDARNATSNFIGLDMYTSSPAVSGASVDYSLGSGQDGVLDPWEGITDEEGENSTTLHPNGDGDFDAYVTSGNDGDELRIDVSGLPPRADDLLLHLDAYTIDESNLTSLSRWGDRTVNGYDATQTDPGSQPTYIEDAASDRLSGPTLEFDGTEFLETEWQPSDDGLDEGAAIFTVVRVSSEGEGGIESPGVLGASGDGFDPEPRLYQSIDGIEPWSGVGDLPDGGGAIDRDEFVIFTTHYDGTDVRLFVDGQLQHEFGPATFSGTSNEFLIGAISGGATYWDNFDGDISEVLVYNQDISEEREDIELYLEEKWFEDVEDPEQDGIELEIDGERDSVTIEEGETVNYQIFETFNDGTEEEVTEEFEGSVTSESPDDVSVDEDANTVTGEEVAEEVTITTEDEDEEFVATVDVTVSDDSPAGFSSQSVSDVERNEAPSSQTLSFTLNESMAESETVEIDLSNAQGDEFDYENSDINEGQSTLRDGSVEFTTQTASETVITFTAAEGLAAGETVDIVVDEVEYDNGNLNTYEAVFDRSDGGSATATYSDFN